MHIQIKKILKHIVNFWFSFFQRRPCKVLGLNESICNQLKVFSCTKVYSETISGGIIKLNSISFDEDKIQHFQSFNSIVNYIIIDTNNSDFQFNRNFCLDPSYNVIYQEGISLFQLPISYQYLHKAKYIKGSVAYLSNSNVNNFGHWFQYTLPLLYFYWKEIGKDNIDYYYVGDIDLKKFQIESLAYLGINSNQIINFPCRADRALVCIKSNPIQFDYASFNDSLSFGFLKNMQINMGDISDENSPKKIYVRRGEVKYRKVVEEEKIIAFLKSRGFAIYSMDGLTLREQAILFYNSEEIIAPHGSALTNIMFCKPHTKLLELFPFKYPDWFNVSFAANAKLNYYYLFGSKVNSLNNPPIYNDIFIDQEKFMRFYETKYS